ncbi:MAG TPA: hypothetical protein OIM45_03670 [Clostridiaceae bacterium]|nr:hypothetical protein [Clostridiaceae bacterium]
MYSKAFKKIEYYLYTYNDIDTQINELKEKMINYEYNQNYGRWIKNKSSSLEDFIIRNDNLKEVIITKCKWKKIIIRVLNKYQKEDKLKYEFINLKYFNKENKFNIKEKLNLSFEEQKNMQNEILQYIYSFAIQNGMLKEAIF